MCFEGLPGGLGVGGAADGALDDAGVGGAEAGEGAVETDGAEALEFGAGEALAGIGLIEAGDPDGAEGVDLGREEAGRLGAAGIAEDGVVEE